MQNENNFDVVRNISIKITEAEMYYASCVEDPAFFVAATSMDELMSFVEVAFVSLYKQRDNIDTVALPMSNRSENNIPWHITQHKIISHNAAYTA